MAFPGLEEQPSVDEPVVVNPIDTAAVYEHEQEIKTVTQVNGDPWTVTWIGQVLAKDDAPRQVDFNLDPSLQQYVRINNYVIYREGALSTSFDSSRNITSVTGSANLVPGNVPNKGDHFIGRLADNRYGVFVIKDMSPFNFYSETSWTIEFELFRILDKDIQAEFDRKVVQELDNNVNKIGCANAVSIEDQLESSANYLSQLVKMYYDHFYDLTTRTFIYPEKGRLYDPMVTRFLVSIIDSNLRDTNPIAQIYETPTAEFNKKHSSVWDTLVDGETYMLKLLDRYVTGKGIQEFHSPYMFGNIFTSQIGAVIFPSSEGTMVRTHYITKDKAKEVPYVFSNAFYELDEEKLLPLEILVLDTLRNKKINFKDIKEQMETLGDIKKQQLFYRIPILIWLVRRFVQTI